MSRILVPIDGSENAIRALTHVLDHPQLYQPLELHLLNVQLPIASGAVRMFFDRGTIRRYHQEEGEATLARARALLDEKGVHYTAHVKVGHIAETVVGTAKELKCDQIVMGTRGLGAASGMWLGSVTMKTLHLADVPVTVIK